MPNQVMPGRRDLRRCYLGLRKEIDRSTCRRVLGVDAQGTVAVWRENSKLRAQLMSVATSTNAIGYMRKHSMDDYHFFSVFLLPSFPSDSAYQSYQRPAAGTAF